MRNTPYPFLIRLSYIFDKEGILVLSDKPELYVHFQQLTDYSHQTDFDHHHLMSYLHYNHWQPIGVVIFPVF